MFAGVTLPRFSWFLTPERVAELTLQAVRRNRDFVRTPWFVKITPLAKALFPRPVFRWFCDWLNVSRGMSSWRGLAATKPLVEAHSLANLALGAASGPPAIATVPASPCLTSVVVSPCGARTDFWD
jgi:hypothetical protein